MLIDELAARLYTELAPDAPRGTQRRATAEVGPHQVAVTLSIDHHRTRTLRWFCDGARVSRPTLLRLLCTEAACPEAQAVQQRWRDFQGQTVPAQALPRRAAAPRPATLIDEVPVSAAGHDCVARPASFECPTRCPQQAHEPRLLRKPGWDLFEDGVWVGGGLHLDTATGTAHPRFASPQAAQDWLIERQRQARGALQACGLGPSTAQD